MSIPKILVSLVDRLIDLYLWTTSFPVLSIRFLIPQIKRYIIVEDVIRSNISEG